MRGQGPPNNWENRHNVPMNSWHETWLNYQRDLDIQEDMEWLPEAVYQFYKVHLDRIMNFFGVTFANQSIIGMRSRKSTRSTSIWTRQALTSQIQIRLWHQLERQLFLNLKGISHSQQLWWWWQLNFIKENLKGSFATMSHILIKSLSILWNRENRWQLSRTSFSLNLLTTSLSRTQHSTLLQDPRRRPRISQVMVLHMSAPNFLVMCGLVRKQSLFTFQKIKLVMLPWCGRRWHWQTSRCIAKIGS